MTPGTVSRRAGGVRELGDGTLSRIVVAIYRLLVVELLLLLTAAPGLALVMVLDRDPSNLPLVALCLLPVAPALTAALSTLRVPEDMTDLAPAVRFFRAYRRDALSVLALWAPLAALVAVVTFTLAHLDVAGVPPWWGAMLVVVAVVGLLWGLNVLVITALFTFRVRDVARLGAYFLARRPLTTLKHLSFLVLVAGIVLVTSDGVLALLGSVLALVLLSTSARLVSDVTKDFTA